MANNNFKKAGKIEGNPICGLCERAALSVKRIFDGCTTRISERDFSFSISVPADAVTPLTYVDTLSSGVTATEGLVSVPRNDNKTLFSYTAVVAVTVHFSDSRGVAYAVSGEVRIPISVVLTLPPPSQTPYSVEVAAALSSSLGSITNEGAVSITPCALVITKITATVDLLLPTYGYVVYPECESAGSAACSGLFTLPVFPEA